jgi:hypothetical protein
VARSNGRRYVFEPGSLFITGRIPLLVEHAWSARVGWVDALRHDPDGCHGLFTITDRRPVHRHRGLSIFPDYGSIRWHRSPEFPNARVVTSCRLVEVSLTSRPRFPQARIT